MLGGDRVTQEWLGCSCGSKHALSVLPLGRDTCLLAGALWAGRDVVGSCSPPFSLVVPWASCRVSQEHSTCWYHEPLVPPQQPEEAEASWSLELPGKLDKKQCGMLFLSGCCSVSLHCGLQNGVALLFLPHYRVTYTLQNILEIWQGETNKKKRALPISWPHRHNQTFWAHFIDVYTYSHYVPTYKYHTCTFYFLK